MMKKLLFILLCYLHTTTVLLCQSSSEIGLYGGLEYNFPSSTQKNAIDDYKSNSGFHVGVKMRHNFGITSFIWGLEYAQMRFTHYNDPNLTSFPLMDPKFNLMIGDQYRLPLLFQLNFGKKKSQFYFNSGASILIGSNRYRTRANASFGDDEKTIYYPEELMSLFNIGYIAAIGYSYQVAPKIRLFTQGNFLLPLVAIQNSFGSQNYDVRTLGVSLSFGISFKTSK